MSRRVIHPSGLTSTTQAVSASDTVATSAEDSNQVRRKSTHGSTSTFVGHSATDSLSDDDKVSQYRASPSDSTFNLRDHVNERQWRKIQAYCSMPRETGFLGVGQDLNTPEECAEVANHIRQYLLKKERGPEMMIDKNFMLRQKDISEKMRTILMDWLVEVHYKFRLLPSTLFLCFNLIDRYLNKQKAAKKRRLQLLGGTCMLIAAKYEEYRPPEVSDICYIMDEVYQKDQVIEMEQEVLNTLKFQLTTASPLQFLQFYCSTVCSLDSTAYFLSCFYLECGAINSLLCLTMPSKLAAASLCRAIHVLFCEQFAREVSRYTDYSFESLAYEMAILSRSACHNDTKSLGKKYAKERYCCVVKHVKRELEDVELREETERLLASSRA